LPRIVFRLEPVTGNPERFGIRMKRSTALATKQDSLARKRALIRSLIEQHGWATTKAPATRDHPAASQAIPSNVIPFPSIGK
jgi:hypothetical protein